MLKNSKIITSTTINRRNLILLGAASAAFPTIAFAELAPPPSSPKYLIFIENGVYKVSPFFIVDLPASAGTCQNYTRSGVSIPFGANFTFTGRSKIGPWQMLFGAPSFRAWEVLDKRTGIYLWFYEGDRIEARFADKSRVKVRFNGPHAEYRFEPIVGSERLPDGTRLYPLDRRGTLGGDGKGRGDKDSDVIQVKPTTTTFSWSWSSQETPW